MAGHEPLAVKTEVAADVVVGIAAGQTVNVAALPTGANTIGAVNLAQYTPASGRLPVELDAAALAALETITVAAISGALPAGNNNIGDVDVASLPALPAGSNNIGTVELSAAALAALETISVAALPALPAGTNNIGDVDVLSLPALPAGSNNIGTVELSATALAALETITAIVTPVVPTTPTVEYATSTAVAPAGTATLNSTSITSGTKKLRKVLFSATAQCRADLVKLENGVESSVLATLLTTNVNSMVQFDSPHDDFITIANSAGADNFRLKVTNLEPAGGGNADVFATFFVNA